MLPENPLAMQVEREEEGVRKEETMYAPNRSLSLPLDTANPQEGQKH
jgi:hypothetical protein